MKEPSEAVLAVVPFDDRFKVGEAYDLPLNHALALQSFPARTLEIAAIRNWAIPHSICLRSEFCLEVRRDGDQVTAARVLSYDYKPQLQQCMPAPKVMPKTMVAEDRSYR